LSSGDTGWTPFTGRSEKDYQDRAALISDRHASGNVNSTEQLYLPAAEVVGYYNQLEPWKAMRITKKVWVSDHNPLRTFRSATHWNNLLKLFLIRLTWPAAKREYELRNDTTWAPKHESGVLWSIDIIMDQINNHPRGEKDTTKPPKKVTAAIWKNRYKTARELLNLYADPADEVVAALDKDVDSDEKEPPIPLKATDDVQSRMQREIAAKPAREQSVSGEAKARMLTDYVALQRDCEELDLEYRPISATYEPSATDVARLKRDVADARAYRSDGALGQIDGEKINEPTLPTRNREIADVISEYDAILAWEDDGGNSGDKIAPVIRAFDWEPMFDAFARAGEKATRLLQEGRGITAVAEVCDDVWQHARPASIHDITGYDGQDFDALDHYIIRPLMAYCGPIDHKLTNEGEAKLVAHVDGLVLEFWDQVFEVVKLSTIDDKDEAETPSPETIEAWRKDIKKAKSHDGFNLKALVRACPNLEDLPHFIAVLREIYPCGGPAPLYLDPQPTDIKVWWCERYVQLLRDGDMKTKKASADPIADGWRKPIKAARLKNKWNTKAITRIGQSASTSQPDFDKFVAILRETVPCEGPAQTIAGFVVLHWHGDDVLVWRNKRASMSKASEENKLAPLFDETSEVTDPATFPAGT
jgi:hypothetical protein